MRADAYQRLLKKYLDEQWEVLHHRGCDPGIAYELFIKALASVTHQ
jgi:hypothetical protein